MDYQHPNEDGFPTVDGALAGVSYLWVPTGMPDANGISPFDHYIDDGWEITGQRHQGTNGLYYHLLRKGKPLRGFAPGQVTPEVFLWMPDDATPSNGAAEPDPEPTPKPEPEQLPTTTREAPTPSVSISLADVAPDVE